MSERQMEMIWRASASMPNIEVFAGAFTSGNYGPPEGLCFDTLCEDDPVSVTYLPLPSPFSPYRNLSIYFRIID